LNASGRPVMIEFLDLDRCRWLTISAVGRWMSLTFKTWNYHRAQYRLFMF